MKKTIKFAVVVGLALAGVVSAADSQWSGAGKVRIIVEVPPVELKDRKSDELVA